MGCGQGKQKITAANKQQEFSNINPNQQQGKLNFLIHRIIVAQNNPNAKLIQKASQQQSPNAQQKKGNTKRSTIRGQTGMDEDGEEFGEEDDEDEEFEEDENGNTIRNKTASNTFLGNTNKSPGKNASFKYEAASPNKHGAGGMNDDPDLNELVYKNQQMQNNISNLKSGFEDDYQRINQGDGTILKRFQDPYDQTKKDRDIFNVVDDPASRDLNSAIDAYQKQMREFKNSLTDINNKANNYDDYVPKRDTYELKTSDRGHLTNQLNNYQSMSGPTSTLNITGESGTYNLDKTQNSNEQFMTQKQMAITKPPIVGGPNNLNQQPLQKPQASFIPLNQKENYQTQDTRGNEKFNINKSGQPNVKPALYDDDDEEFRESNYYNFDNGYQKSEGGLVGRGYKVEASGGLQKQGGAVDFVKMDGSPSKGQDNQINSNHYSNIEYEKLTIDQLNVLKEEFMEQEERERLNPQNVLLRILMIHAFDSQVEHEEMALERKLYSFFVNKNSNILDIKEKIRKDFGFESDQLRIFFKYKEIKNPQYIFDLENFDIEEDILMCISINTPRIQLKVILREPLEDIKIADVRFLNSRDRSEVAKVDPFWDIEQFDVDQDKLPWPIYRDWTAELSYLHSIILKHKQQLLSDEYLFQLQQGINTDSLHQNPQLAELIEAESAYRRLCEDFKRASLQAVHLIVKKNPTPLNLFNLYGDEGDKYIVGGIIVRRAKDWMICGEYFTEQHMATTIVGQATSESGSNLTEISGKIASLDVRNLALLRCRLDKLVVPLACLVDYYGLKFETQSLAPISINSVAYGSDTNGILFNDFDQEAEQVAIKMSNYLNLKPHFIQEQATQKVKKIYLPYTIQLHRNKDLQGDTNLYLVNPFRLFPQDESVREQKNTPNFQEIMSKQLRPEHVIQNNKGEPASNYQYFTWKQPTKCDECGEYIMEYDYYYFEKRSVDKSQKLLAQYYCCQNCYQQLLPTEGFKYPVNKIVRKELPMKDRLQFWLDQDTGKRYYDIQFKKIPLNPDAYFELCNPKDRQEKISDQEEILRAAQKLKDDVIGKLIEDLNNVEEDPLSSEQLEQILHQRGITMRTLGKICTNAQLNHIREMAVIEVIARSAKLLIKDGLTFLADDEEAGFKAENIKKCILHYFQEIFNMDEYQQTSTQNIWDFITEHARKKFQVTVERDILQKIHLNGLLISLCKKLNIKLTKSLRDIDFTVLTDDNQPAFITINDFGNIIPIVKDYLDKSTILQSKEEIFPCSLNLILEIARLKDSQGRRSLWHMKGGEEREHATELFRLAASTCEQIYGSKSIQYARVLKELAEQLESRHQEKGRPENSRWNKSFAISEDELSMEARYFFQNALQVLMEIKQELSIEAAGIYIGLARLFKQRGSQFSHYREKEADIQEMYQNLNNAIDIYDTVLGLDHPETADAYTKMALAYQEQGNFKAAAPWIRRAFGVFYKCFGPYDEITLNTYEYLKSVEINIDSKFDQVPYEQLPLKIQEIELQSRYQAMYQQPVLPTFAVGGAIGGGKTIVPPQLMGISQKLALANH